MYLGLDKKPKPIPTQKNLQKIYRFGRFIIGQGYRRCPKPARMSRSKRRIQHFPFGIDTL
jgi:hypothetical protein